MSIPVRNIYYIFCYAWQRLDIGESLPVGLEDASDAKELFAKVLVHASASIVKKGLDRDYVPMAEDLSCPKGKIVFSDTIKRNLFEQRKLHCSYDELSSNILHNQIIKTTLVKLASTRGIDKELRDELKLLSDKFYGVDVIQIRPHHFRQVILHRNNAYYDFLLKICEMVNLNLLPQENGQGYSFADVLNDETKMGKVFESFVRNFYAVEQDRFKVKAENIKWDAEAEDEEDLAYLPMMTTDISLDSADKKIIIDTKYYRKTMQTHMETEKVHSGHLYQLNAYLSNIENRGYPENEAEGILLYPTVNKPLDLSYTIKGHKMRVYTVDMNRPWQEIKNDLLSLVAQPH